MSVPPQQPRLRLPHVPSLLPHLLLPGVHAVLVFSRERDESFFIGDNIIITVLDIRSDKVKLGIEAPSEIPVHRREVYETILRENLRANRIKKEDYDHAMQTLRTVDVKTRRPHS